MPALVVVAREASKPTSKKSQLDPLETSQSPFVATNGVELPVGVKVPDTVTITK
jgi:hypothetical protein